MVDASRHASAVALFDISLGHTGDTAKALKTAEAKDIRISAEYFMDPALEGFLQESHVDTLWVEYHPALVTSTPEVFLARVRELSARFTCIPISGDLDFLTVAFQTEWHAPVIALKGSEAAGFASRETAGVLYVKKPECPARKSGDEWPKGLFL